LATTKAKVANLLVSNAKTWVPTSDVTAVAGPGATARLRELRREGWSIQTKREGTNFFYKLSRVPAKRVLAQFNA